MTTFFEKVSERLTAAADVQHLIVRPARGQPFQDTFDLVLEQAMYALAGHLLFELAAGRYPQRLDLPGQSRVDKIERLKSTIGLLGDHKGNILQLAFPVGQSTVALVGNDDRGPCGDEKRDQNPAEHEQVSCPRTGGE